VVRGASAPAMRTGPCSALPTCRKARTAGGRRAKGRPGVGAARATSPRSGEARSDHTPIQARRKSHLNRKTAEDASARRPGAMARRPKTSANTPWLRGTMSGRGLSLARRAAVASRQEEACAVARLDRSCQAEAVVRRSWRGRLFRIESGSGAACGGGASPRLHTSTEIASRAWISGIASSPARGKSCSSR